MFKTLRQAPFLRLLLFFSAGVISSYLVDISRFLIPVFCIGCVIVSISTFVFFHLRYRYRWVFGCGLFLVIFSLAGILTENQLKLSDWEVKPGCYSYQVRLTDDPVRKTKTRMCKATIINSELGIQNDVIDKKVIIYLPLDSLSLSLLPGDCLSISAKLSPPKPGRNQSSFDYGSYLRKQGIAAVGFVRKGNWSELHSYESSMDIQFYALKCRYGLLKFIHEMIPDERSASLASAMVFGFRNDMDKELINSFSATGVSHILSVSGMHVGILYALFLFLLSFLGNGWKGRVTRQLVVLVSLWFFAFLTGLSPSVVRCVTMLSLTSIGVILSRDSFSLNTITASALFMLCYNPMYLYDVSFQLSYLAVVSIVVINPLLTRVYEPKQIILKYIWELSCVSVSAQLGTLPLTLYYFHQFPTVFLLANLFVIPLTGLLMLMIPVSLFLSLGFPWMKFLTIPVNFILSVYISGVELLEKIPFGVVKNISVDLPGAFLILFSLLSVGLLLTRRRVIYLYLSVLLAVFQVFYYL